MALVLSSAARLKPEIRLAEAVSKYEASLSSEQKVIFRNQRTNALKSAPSSNDVMRCTAEIDRRLSSKGGSRCFGPRFTNFIQGVQQFAALGDIVVGGSQNIIACGVWSLVRMSLLATVSISSYIENLSMLFMEIGRSAPRYQMIGVLYSRSKDLQAHINEYFIVVVNLCQHIWSHSQKSVLQRIASSLSDADIKAYRYELDAWARSIRDEVNLLMAKRIEEEAQNNSKSRAFRAIVSKVAAHQQTLAAKMRTLDLCSTYNYEMAWKQIRKKGTTQLFAQTDDYQAWKTSIKSATLAYSGMLGSGKSVMMANIVEDLNIYIEKRNGHVAYFFCQPDDVESLKSRTIIGTLVRQILANLSWKSSVSFTALDYDNMFDLLAQSLAPDEPIFIVIDGLEACPALDHGEIVEEIVKLQKDFLVLCCYSVRGEPIRNSYAASLPGNIILDHTMVPLPDNESDIATFLEVELTRCLESRDLVVGDPALVLEMRDALFTKSKGMFLWVALQIRSLCTMQTDDQIREAIAYLPEDLSGVYSRILDKQQGPAKTNQKRIFELVTAAQRRLTVNELREALSVEPGDTEWKAGKLINDIYSTLASCGCLVNVDEEDYTVKLIHPSVEQYVCERYRDPSGFELTVGGCHRAMADTIVTYLNYDIFGTDISTYRVPQIEVGSAPSKVIASTIASFGGAQSIALKLLKSRKRPDFNIGKTIAERLNIDKRVEALELHFRHYAESYCIQHVSKANTVEPYIVKLLPKIHSIFTGSESTGISWTDAWSMALEHGSVGMAKMLLRTGKEMLGTSWRLNAQLEMADCETMRNRGQILNLILESGLITSWPVSEANHPTARHLRHLVKSVYPRLGTSSGGTRRSEMTALISAIRAEHLAAFKVLLDSRRFDVNQGRPRQTPIWEAVRLNNSAIVNLLLHSGGVIVEEEEQQALLSLVSGADWVLRIMLKTAAVGRYLSWSHAIPNQAGELVELDCGYSENERISNLLGKSGLL